MTGRERLQAALAGEGVAFAPIVWEQLDELVRQPRAGWWRDPTAAQRLIADAAALCGADAMFAFGAMETVHGAAAAGERGDDAIDALAGGSDAESAAELVACVHDVAAHGVIAAVPAPAAVGHALGGDEPEAAEDAFSDLARAALEAGADALAVCAGGADDVEAGVRRAVGLAELFDRPVLGLCLAEGAFCGWVDGGLPCGVLSELGEWPSVRAGVVLTPGDVSGRWDAERLRAAGVSGR